MGADKERKSRRNTEHFIKITQNVYDHPAWQALSAKSVAIYLAIKRRYNGRNNGEISLSIREASQAAHCGKSTALKALDELQAHGFIAINNKGHFHNRHATTWRLTCKKTEDQDATKDWKGWKAE